VVLEVEDNGVGFDADKPPPAGHRGLVNLRQRATAIGAVVALNSTPGATRLELRLPLNR
jgi:signal transduction histidine kinase